MSSALDVDDTQTTESQAAATRMRNTMAAVRVVFTWLGTSKTLSTDQKVLAAHLRRKPKPFEELGVSCPQALEALLLRCLSKQPQDRPADGSVFYKEIYDISQGLPWDMDKASSWWLDEHRLKTG